MATVDKDFKVKNGILAGSTIVAPAATTAIPSIRLPHGSAPTTPTDGDFWTTTAGVYARVNGATVGPFGAGTGGGSTYTFATTPPGSSNAGDVWQNSNTMAIYTYINDGNSNQWVDTRSPGVSSGGASAGTATPLALGTATAGTAAGVSHEDHVHPTTGLAVLSAANVFTNVQEIDALASGIGLILKSNATTPGNTLESRDSSGTALASISAAGNMTAASFIKTGGTSSQFLKADGSVDSTTYAGASAASYAAMRGFTTIITSASTVTLTNTSTPYQLFTGSTAQTVTLPVTSTLTTGWTFHIDNDSTATMTINSSGGNLVLSVPPLFCGRIICIGTALTTAADWDAIYTEFHTYTGSGNMVFGTAPTITGLALAAGTTTVAPLDFATGTNLTTATAGAVEYDGTSFYATPAAVRAAVPASFVSRKAATITIATATGGQSLLANSTAASASTGIALAAATTYEFEIRFALSTTGTTSHTEAIGFYYSGTTSFYNIVGERTVANVATTAVKYAQIASGTTLTSNIISVVMTPAITTAQTNAIYEVRGWVTTNTAGNWTPTLAFSAAPGATSTIQIGSTVKLTPYQSASGVVNISAWA